MGNYVRLVLDSWSLLLLLPECWCALISSVYFVMVAGHLSRGRHSSEVCVTEACIKVHKGSFTPRGTHWSSDSVEWLHAV